MAKMVEVARSLLTGEGGATMVEYVLMLLLVAMIVFSAAAALGVSLVGPYQQAITGLS